MKLDTHSMGFKPTLPLRRILEREAKQRRRKVGDVIRLRLLEVYKLLPKEGA